MVKILKNPVFIFITVFVYVLLLYFVPPVFLITGLFYIILVLLSLEKVDKGKVLIILSPILTYSVYIPVVSVVLFTIYHDTIFWELEVFIMVFALVNIPILLKIEKWIEPKMKKFLLIGFVLLTVVAVLIGELAVNCTKLSDAEGKGSQDIMGTCESFNMYDENLGGRSQAGFARYQVSVASHGPAFVALILSVLMYAKVRKK